MTDKTAPRVTIMHHPDVRRSLMLQKAYAEGMRALVLYTASIQDRIQVATAAGERDDDAAALNDLLLPLVKGVGSERAFELLTQSLQTLGGSGYLQDYPIEQYLRDAKIDSLYEGTTAIQGLDLYFRKIVRNQGAALGRLIGEIREFAAADGGNGRLKAERSALRRAADDVDAMVGRDARLPGGQPGAAGRDLPRRAEHHPAAAGPGRPGGRLAAGPAGRGGAGPAGRGPRSPPTGRSTRARWRGRRSSRPRCCRG